MLLCRPPQQIGQEAGLAKISTACAGEAQVAARPAMQEVGQAVSPRQENAVVAGKGR